MKLKHIALAAMLAATGVANAAIDTGADSNGDFFFSIWDSAKSYTRDLNIQTTSFYTDVAAPGSYKYEFDLASDAVFAGFISTANLSELKWNISMVETQGAKTVIDTYSTLPAARITNDLGRTMAAGTGAFATAVNNGMTAQGTTDSAVFASATPGYANNAIGSIPFGDSHGLLLNFKNTGTVANNSYVAGLGLVKMDFATQGILPGVYTPIVDPSNASAVRAYMEGDYNLVITAVPEPESYAMLLAGLGLMGAIARRRQNKA